MDTVKGFLKQNKKSKENIKVALSKEFLDDSGNALEWELRAITTEENNDIIDACTYEVKTRSGVETKLRAGKYNALLLASSVVYPDLYNKELQDSYEVKKPEDLILKMLDSPADFSKALEIVSKLSGLDELLEDKVEEAKN